MSTESTERLESRQQVVKRLREKRDLSDADPSNLDLSGLKLTALNMEGANLSKTNLEKAVVMEGRECFRGRLWPHNDSRRPGLRRRLVQGQDTSGRDPRVATHAALAPGAARWHGGSIRRSPHPRQEAAAS